MGFIMSGLDAEDYDRSYGDRELLGRILGYFRPHGVPMLIAAVMILLNSVTSLVQPVIGAWGLDRLEQGTLDEVLWLFFAGMFGAGVLAWVFNFVRAWLSARAVGDVVLDLRKDAFAAILRRDLSFFDTNPSGKIVSRVTSDSDEFANVVTLSLSLVSQVLMLVLLVVILYMRSVLLASLTIAFAPLIVLAALGFRKIARETTRDAQRSTARVNSTVQEGMNGIAVAKAFRQERTLYNEFVPILQQAYKVSLKQGLVFQAIFPLLFLLSGLGSVAIVYVGGDRAISGEISPGDWFLFMQSVFIFWGPLTSISSFWSQFQQGLGASERIFALIDAEPEVVQVAEEDPGDLRGKIEFRDLTFRYGDGPNVLQDFNLEIPAGQTLAIVGHTGAGKSTLGKLITRFYEFQGGELLIDGKDIRTFDLPAYRRQLGIVPQSPFLFSGTVADNIRYPKPDATDDEVMAAARMVAGGDWVEALQDGLQTDVGEYGKALSMGQRQLVALARVLIQDPAIVILDEATASVDPLTEAQIQEGLDVVLADRTSIVIAHRLSTIENADRIIVLDHGEVVEEGTHRSLLALGGRYCDVYNTYFRHQSPNYVPGGGFVGART
ncbi:MAG TPA: ABC transporter ATP-binding protein [Thermomicrobiales bacterium]|nr:ABC transporter ATP-binding protein [Thermomicrobiales bacterium]